MAWVMTRHGARGTRYTGAYRDPDGATRSAGSFSTRREALRAANREEQKVLAGAWHDSTHGDITFRAYVEKDWLPNKHVEASTRAAYISYLDKHFYPFFGHRRLNKISPSLVGRAGNEALGGSDELADHHRPGVNDYTEAPQVLLVEEL